jgi:hypothetical protein
MITYICIYIYLLTLFRVIKSCIKIPEDGQYGQNMSHILTQLTKSVVVDGKTYVSFNTVYHNRINSTKKFSY